MKNLSSLSITVKPVSQSHNACLTVPENWLLPGVIILSM